MMMLEVDFDRRDVSIGKQLVLKLNWKSSDEPTMLVVVEVDRFELSEILFVVEAVEALFGHC